MIFDIEHDGYSENYLYCQNAEAFSNTYYVGGRNYTLDFNTLEQDLTIWFGKAEHSAYTSSLDVMTGNDDTDKLSLLAVYTKDTADCFV